MSISTTAREREGQGSGWWSGAWSRGGVGGAEGGRAHLEELLESDRAVDHGC